MQTTKPLLLIILVITQSIPAVGIGADSVAARSEQDRNRELARQFYEDLWFSDNTERYSRYMADTYVAHDIGERKNSVEAAIVQKQTADRFHGMATMTGEIDFQIAERDLVATRWHSRMDDAPWWMSLLGGSRELPIINVFRFKDGKIVELWNHRHDIDSPLGNVAFVKGLAVGLAIALVGWVLAALMWRRQRRLLGSINATSKR